MATVSKPRHRQTYMHLVRAFPLASIRSEGQLKKAQRVIDHLLAQGILGDEEEMYLDALSDLVAVYEDRCHPIAPASDADMLRHLIEARDINQLQLHRGAGIPKSTISEILAGKRPFTRQVIRRLADFFQVDVGVLAANL